MRNRRILFHHHQFHNHDRGLHPKRCRRSGPGRAGCFFFDCSDPKMLLRGWMWTWRCFCLIQVDDVKPSEVNLIILRFEFCGKQLWLFWIRIPTCTMRFRMKREFCSSGLLERIFLEGGERYQLGNDRNNLSKYMKLRCSGGTSTKETGGFYFSWHIRWKHQPLQRNQFRPQGPFSVQKANAGDWESFSFELPDIDVLSLNVYNETKYIDIHRYTDILRLWLWSQNYVTSMRLLL